MQTYSITKELRELAKRAAGRVNAATDVGWTCRVTAVLNCEPAKDEDGDIYLAMELVCRKLDVYQEAVFAVDDETSIADLRERLDNCEKMLLEYYKRREPAGDNLQNIGKTNSKLS